MNRQFIDDGMGNKIDVTTLDGKPFIGEHTSADKHNRIVTLPDNMRYTPIADNEDIEQDDDNHYGELAINLILIALIIAGLVLSYNIGFYK